MVGLLGHGFNAKFGCFWRQEYTFLGNQFGRLNFAILLETRENKKIRRQDNSEGKYIEIGYNYREDKI